MQHSKLITLLQSFSSKEWKAFDKYLHSPYLNANKRLIRFYGLLKRHHPVFDPKKLKRPSVFTALFPQKEQFDDRLLRSAMADLHKAAESFLVFEKLKKDKRTRDKLLVQSYSERDHYLRFERRTNDLLTSINAQPTKSMDDYLDVFLLNKDHYFHPRTEALATSVASLKNAVQSLDQFYALAKLRLSCELSARSNIVAEEAEYPMLQTVIQHTENNLLKIDPTFGIYLDLLKINLDGLTEDLFFALKIKYSTTRNKLSFLEQKEVLIYLINYAYRLALSVDRSFFYEQFELYKIGLEHNLLLEKGILPDIRFTNIVVIGATIKKWEWTKNFINSFHRMLSPKIANDAIYLSEAYLYFHKGDFFKTDELVNRISTNKIDYKIRQYSLSISSLFEITLNQKDYIDLLVSRTFAYEKYLSRQKILSKNRILAENNFIKIIKKMSAVIQHNNNQKDQWISLRREVEKTNPLAAKKWILEKLSKNME